MQDVAEEFVGIDGNVYVGVHGVAVAPVDAGGAPGVSWTDLGLTTNTGVTRSEPTTQQTRRAWQNNTKLRTLVTEAAVRFQTVLVQTNPDTIELFHGQTLTDGSLVTNPGVWPTIAFLIDIIDGDNVIREYAPTAQVVEIGDQVAVAGDTFGWPVTIEATYDATLGGYTERFFSEFEEAADPFIATVAAAGTEPAGTGDLVLITGTSFTGATAVTIDAIAMTEFDVFDSTTIYAILPSDGAGAVNVVVTTPAGTSNSKSYTRGA